MAFLSNFVLNELVEKIKLTDEPDYLDKVEFIKNIIDNEQLYPFFNQLNLIKLYRFKKFLINSDNLSNFRYVEESEDNKNFVFLTGGKLKFHLYKDCLSFNSTFYDFKVPLEISERKDEDLLRTYRRWFKDRKFKELIESGDIVNNDILKMYNDLFAKTHHLKKLENFDFIVEFKSTSPIQVPDSFISAEFHRKVNSLIVRRHDLCTDKTKRFLSKFDYLYSKTDDEIIDKLKELSENHSDLVGENFVKNYGIINLKNFFKEHHNLKILLTKLLKRYFLWNYKVRDKNFDTITLESFGLQCCKKCESKKILENQQLNQKV